MKVMIIPVGHWTRIIYENEFILITGELQGPSLFTTMPVLVQLFQLVNSCLQIIFAIGLRRGDIRDVGFLIFLPRLLLQL